MSCAPLCECADAARRKIYARSSAHRSCTALSQFTRIRCESAIAAPLPTPITHSTCIHWYIFFICIFHMCHRSWEYAAMANALGSLQHFSRRWQGNVFLSSLPSHMLRLRIFCFFLLFLVVILLVADRFLPCVSRPHQTETAKTRINGELIQYARAIHMDTFITCVLCAQGKKKIRAFLPFTCRKQHFHKRFTFSFCQCKFGPIVSRAICWDTYSAATKKFARKHLFLSEWKSYFARPLKSPTISKLWTEILYVTEWAPTPRS